MKEGVDLSGGVLGGVGERGIGRGGLVKENMLEEGR
jgi:hypothetical protein